jgi:hypothetical protein
MNNGDPTPFTVHTQGIVKVIFAKLYRRGDDVAIVQVEADFKRPIVGFGGYFDGIPSLAMAEPGQESRESEPTHITLDAFKGWTVLTIDTAKSTSMVVLVKGTP